MAYNLLSAQVGYEHYSAGKDLVGTGDEKAASKEFAKAVKADPNNALYLKAHAITLQKLGKTDDAIRVYDSYLKIKPDDFNVWNEKGWLHTSLGDYKDAVACFTEVIKIDPENGDAYLNRSFARKEIKDKSGAIDDLSKALSYNSNLADKDIIDAVDLYLSDKTEEACDKLKHVHGASKELAKRLTESLCKDK